MDGRPSNDRKKFKERMGEGGKVWKGEANKISRRRMRMWWLEPVNAPHGDVLIEGEFGKDERKSWVMQ